jgi:hypothetical protein
MAILDIISHLLTYICERKEFFAPSEILVRVGEAAVSGGLITKIICELVHDASPL